MKNRKLVSVSPYQQIQTKGGKKSSFLSFIVVQNCKKYYEKKWDFKIGIRELAEFSKSYERPLWVGQLKRRHLEELSKNSNSKVKSLKQRKV